MVQLTEFSTYLNLNPVCIEGFRFKVYCHLSGMLKGNQNRLIHLLHWFRYLS